MSTDLHIVDGELAEPKLPLVPGCVGWRFADHASRATRCGARLRAGRGAGTCGVACSGQGRNGRLRGNSHERHPWFRVCGSLARAEHPIGGQPHAAGRRRVSGACAPGAGGERTPSSTRSSTRTRRSTTCDTGASGAPPSYGLHHESPGNPRVQRGRTQSSWRLCGPAIPSTPRFTPRSAWITPRPAWITPRPAWITRSFHGYGGVILRDGDAILRDGEV